MQRREICCNYRSWANYLIIVISLMFLCLTTYSVILFKDFWIFAVSIAVFVYTFYFIMETINRKVIMVENKIIVYNIFGVSKIYEISNISKIVVSNNVRSKYVVIYIKSKKIKIQKTVQKYDEFIKELFEILQIQGYSKGGIHVYDF